MAQSFQGKPISKNRPDDIHCAEVSPNFVKKLPPPSRKAMQEAPGRLGRAESRCSLLVTDALAGAYA
jgi:hypothetical protein